MKTRDNWATPQELVDLVAAQGFHGLDPRVDLCASATNAKASNYVTSEWVRVGGERCAHSPLGLFGFTCEQLADWLKQDLRPVWWAWMNPPYGQIYEFAEYAVAMSEHVPVAICTPASVNTRWFHELILPNADTIFTPNARVNFLPPAGIKASSAAHNTIISILSESGRTRSGPQVKVLDWRSVR